jgi:Spy/CpxP family protein refolding chaperone
LLVNSIQHPHPKIKNHPAAANVETHPPAEPHEPPARTNNPANLSRPPEILDEKFVQQLDDKLQLTADQRAAIQKIIADGQERNHSIWTNSSAQMRAVIQDVRHRVREVLTADQQKQFEELMKRVPRRQNSTNAPTGSPLTNSQAIAPTNATAN